MILDVYSDFFKQNEVYVNGGIPDHSAGSKLPQIIHRSGRQRWGNLLIYSKRWLSVDWKMFI